jgi:hypothetical protein
VLRFREPQLARPFSAGSLAMTFVLGAGPTALIGYALYASRADEIVLAGHHLPALVFSLLIALCGPVYYGVARLCVAKTPAAA